MRVLVTGGCGFIGSHNARRLVGRGEDVVVLDKLNVLREPGEPQGPRTRVCAGRHRGSGRSRPGCSERGRVYNVAASEELENIDVTRSILEPTGRDESLVRHVDDRPGHDRRYSLDTSRLRALGWEPRHSFDEGLKETVEWYRALRDWWEPLKSGEHRAYYERQYAGRLT